MKEQETENGWAFCLLATVVSFCPIGDFSRGRKTIPSRGRSRMAGKVKTCSFPLRREDGHSQTDGGRTSSLANKSCAGPRRQIRFDSGSQRGIRGADRIYAPPENLH